MEQGLPLAPLRAAQPSLASAPRAPSRFVCERRGPPSSREIPTVSFRRGVDARWPVNGRLDGWRAFRCGKGWLLRALPADDGLSSQAQGCADDGARFSRERASPGFSGCSTVRSR